MAEGPSEAEIVAALSASGFLMEQEVATAFESSGFHASTGRAYTDPEEGKSRELDVFGFLRHMYDEKRKASIHIRLLCECKNTANPYLFLTRQKTKGDLAQTPEEYLFPMRVVEVASGAQVRHVDPFKHYRLGEHHYRFQNQLKAVQIVRLDRRQSTWVAENTSIFTSLTYPLVKALRAFQAEHGYAMGALARGFTLPGMPAEGRDWAQTDLYFPMVVVPSPLWAVNVHREDIRPERVPFITLERELKSNVISGRFAIDFVQQAHIGEFLTQRVIPFAAAVERALWAL